MVTLIPPLTDPKRTLPGIKAMRIFKGYIFLLILAAVFSGCSGESVELRNTVIAYNAKLSEALAKPDESVMEFFVTPAERKRISSNIVYIRKDRRLLVARLLGLEFQDVTVSGEGDKAKVRTRERWSKHFIDQRTRKPLTGDVEEEFENTYSLLKLDGRWVVDRVTSRRNSGQAEKGMP